MKELDILKILRQLEIHLVSIETKYICVDRVEHVWTLLRFFG